MRIRHYKIILLAVFLSACASTQNRQIAEQNRQGIDDALSEAATVSIPEAESPSAEILDDLMPGSGITVPGLDQDVRLENAFDISVANAPARLFFMSLVKDTHINMVVHPGVEGEISLDLKNVTVREVLDLTREVYGYEFKQNNAGYIVLPRSGIEWGIFQSINNGVCAESTVINNAAFAGFSVEVQCSPTTHIEGGPAIGTIVTYSLIAIARSGVFGSLDYAQRLLQAKVSLDPP